RSLPTFCFFTPPATTTIYTLSLHDALPISGRKHLPGCRRSSERKDSGADDCSDPDRREIEGAERAFELALRSSRLGHEMLRAFSSEKISGHLAANRVIATSARSLLFVAHPSCR